MFLRILSMLIVLFCAAFAGYMKSKTFAIRPQQLRELQMLLELMLNDLTYMSTLLSDLLISTGSRTNSQVGMFFIKAGETLKFNNGIRASKAWEKAVVENIGYTCLDEEDKIILINFGLNIGNSDIEGQARNIKAVLQQLKMQEHKAEEIRRKNEPLYKKIGVLAGLAAVIILI